MSTHGCRDLKLDWLDADIVINRRSRSPVEADPEKIGACLEFDWGRSAVGTDFTGSVNNVANLIQGRALRDTQSSGIW